MEGAEWICPGCSAPAAADAKFCSQCGAALAAGPEARKVVTALFADIVGSTTLGERLDPEDFRALIGDAVARIVEIVEDLGGSVKQLAGDGVLAVFGAPVTHEDDAERALRAGLRIVSDIPVSVSSAAGVDPLEVRVGIETGLVVLGPVGAGRKVEYGAMGDALNTAARLQSHAAPCTVLVGPRTHRLAEPLFDWGEPRELTLKGKAEPVVAHQLRGSRALPRGLPRRPGAAAPLVGRERELALTGERVECVLAGTGGVVVLAGEAGLGKTRLLAEVRQSFEGGSAAHGEPLWLEGRCASYGEALPYWPFQAIVRDWLGVPAEGGDAGDAAELADRLARALADEGRDAFPLLASLLGLRLEDADAAQLRSFPPDQLQRMIRDAFAGVIERLAASGPVVLALEDVHWADPSSEGLAEHLLALSDRAAVLLVLTGRPEPDRPLRRLAEAAVRELPHRLAEVRLDALPQAAERELLRELVGDGTLPAALEAAILDRAEGNPLYLEELVRALVDAGAVVRDADGWRFDHDVQLEIPETLEQIVLARVDRLDERARSVLGAAAVIGRQFNRALLERVAAATGVEGALGDLQRLDLVREVRRWPEPEYRFRHSLIREAAYNALLKTRRQELHLRAAQALEGAIEDAADDRAGILAQHYRLGDDHERALEWHGRAAAIAADVHAQAEALAHYDHGLAEASAHGLGPRDPRVRRLLLGRSWVHNLSGRLEQSLADAEQALAGARDAGDHVAEIEALQLIAVNRRLIGDWDGGAEALAAAIAVAERERDEPAQAHSHRWLSIMYSNQLRLDLALEHAHRALEIAGRHGDEDSLGAALDALKLAALYVGDLETLEDAAGRLASMQRRTGNLSLLQWALQESAFAPLARARFEAAVERVSEALDVNRRCDDRLGRPIILATLCWIERSRGRYGAALAAGRDAVASSRDIGLREWHAWAAADLGVCLLEIGAADQAVGELEDGLAAAEGTGAPAQRLRCTALLAEANAAAGAAGPAAALAGKADGLLEAITAPPGGAWLWGGHATLALARTRLALGEPRRARDLAAPVVSAAERAGWRELVAAGRLVLAGAEAELSGEGQAHALAETALGEASGAGLPGVEWRAHLALARLLADRDRGAEADAHVAAARALVDRLAADVPDLGLRRTLLEAIPAAPAAPRPGL